VETPAQKQNRSTKPLGTGTRAEILRRVKEHVAAEIMHVRRAANELGADANPLIAMWSTAMHRSPAANRARGFLSAIALILDEQPDSITYEVAAHAMSDDLELRFRYVDPDIPF
jgi:hypothetical protein